MWVQVLESVEAAARAKGPLRDHRSLLPHLDDHLRICHIAKEKGASFRSLPGVVSWGNRKSQISATSSSVHVNKLHDHNMLSRNRISVFWTWLFKLSTQFYLPAEGNNAHAASK